MQKQNREMERYEPLFEESVYALFPTGDKSEEALIQHALDPAHLDSEQIFDWLERKLGAAQRAKLGAHLASCAFCRQQLQEAGEVVEPEPVATLWDQAARWREHLSDQLSRARMPVRSLNPALQFSTDVPTVTAQRLDFEDGMTSGRLTEKQGQRWLHLESRSSPTGTLFLVRIGLPDTDMVWTRFVMLRDGFRASVAELALDAEEFNDLPLEAGAIDYRRLLPEDGEALTRSFQAARQEDPLSVPVWRQWAQAALQEFPSASLLHNALTEILNEVT